MKLGTWIRSGAAAAAVALTLVLPVAALAQQSTATVGMIELKGTPVESPGPLAWLMGGDAEPTLADIVDKIDSAATRADLAGVVIRLRDAKLKMSQVDEIGAAMERVRAAGKPVEVFAESYGTPGLLLGAHADEVIIQAGGAVMLPGIYMEEMYLADTLKWVGLQADFVQVGAYKGADEAMTRTGPSPEWDQNLSALLDSLYARLRQTLKDGRKLTDAQLDNAMKTAWMATDETAIKVGLVDASVDLPDLSTHLEKVYGKKVTWNKMNPTGSDALNLDGGNPFALFAMLTKQPKNTPTRATIALVHIDGPIVDGDSSNGGLFGGEVRVGSRTIRNALSQIEDNDLIKGLIVRIDSPGGSAIASDVIWRGVRRVAAKKPVWVSVGSMAASGGYYIAVSGDKIYVTPSSIVGSIGVVGGKLAMAGLFDKLKLHVVPRSRGPMAGIFRSSATWTDEERDMVRQKMVDTYGLFTKRVTAGRPDIDLSKTAEGRLFVGQAAIDMKMADKIGGLETAVSDMAGQLGLTKGSYDVMDYPGPKSLQEYVQDMFGSKAAAPHGIGGLQAAAQALEELVGPTAWPSLRDSMVGLMQLRDEPVLLMSPRALIFR